MVQPQAQAKTIRSFALIGTVVGLAALAFAYTAGWLSPQRLTPGMLLGALQPPGGPALGHRRNHAKGICFTGVFEANGQGSTLSTAQVFATGRYPVIGRFNIAGADPKEPDPMAQVRGLGLSIMTPDGEEWRSAMIDAPVFAAPTAEAFYQFLMAASSKDPEAMKQYSAAHPEIVAFLSWVKNHSRTGSWTQDRFNSLDSFILVGARDSKHAVRWSFVPAAQVVNLTSHEIAERAPDFLADDITERVRERPQYWELVITIANVGDPTSDPTTPWPTGRRTIDVGTLAVQHIEPEAGGPCRDINFDPTVLPSGITTSDDPIPAARSAAYALSYDRRTAEASHYPKEGTGRDP